MKDRRDKDLHYYCDSKWYPGHKCSNPKLFLIDDVIEEVEEEDLQYEKGKEVVEFPALLENPKISLHAWLASSNPKTIKVKGKIFGQWVAILIDFGSTDNFVDTAVDKKT